MVNPTVDHQYYGKKVDRCIAFITDKGIENQETMLSDFLP